LIEARTNPLIIQSIMQTKDILEKLGAVLGPNGLFIDPDEDTSIELKGEIGGADDLIDGFIRDLEQHDKSLHESREIREKNLETKEAGRIYESSSENYHNSIASSTDHFQ